MTLLFLPIDIDIKPIDFNRDNLKKMPVHSYQPKWWDSAIMDVENIELNSLMDIFNQLPYDKITMAMHKFQNEPVGEHFDVYPQMKISPEEYKNITDNEPCGYRIVLKGNNDRLSLWDGESWVTPILPSVPCCYLINATHMKHKVSDDPGREIIYIRGIINSDRHKELLDRSLQKYGDHAVYLKD